MRLRRRGKNMMMKQIKKHFLGSYMKKLLLLPILLFAFNAASMEHLDEAQEIFEQSEVSEVEEAEASEAAESSLNESQKNSGGQTEFDDDDIDEILNPRICPARGQAIVCKQLITPAWRRFAQLPLERRDSIRRMKSGTFNGTDHKTRQWNDSFRCYNILHLCVDQEYAAKVAAPYVGSWVGLHVAVYDNDYEYTDFLLQKNTDPNSRHWRHGVPYCFARTNKMKRLLERYGANTNPDCPEAGQELKDFMDRMNKEEERI